MSVSKINKKTATCKGKVSLFIKNIIKNKSVSNKRCVQSHYKEERLESIKKRLNEIEESVLNYNQYKSHYEENPLSINIRELEKVYCDIID